MGMIQPWSGDLLRDHFARLDTWLAEHRALWQPRAFYRRPLPWERELPDLAAALRDLPLERSEALAGDGAALGAWLQPHIAGAAAAPALCALPVLPARAPIAAPEPRDVPGRKWRQILAFAAHLPDAQLPVLEWCAGKAHLGRALAEQRGCAVTALDWDTALVTSGTALAQREQLPVQLHRVDVLSAAGAAFVQREQQALALHACGELHLQLLRQCAQRHTRALLVAPCCYHLIAPGDYRPLSAIAQRGMTQLNRDDLRTAVQETVTSPPRVQEQRRRLQAWRLGFDALQRELRGRDEYLPTPPLPLSVLATGFAACCRRLAAAKGLELPAAVHWESFERLGAQRLREVAALDLVRLLFRRPLELWLLLDRALFLQERGYTVAMGTFCERALTPRNVLLRAEHSG